MPEHPGDLLSALLDGELTAEDASAVRAHVDGCVACAAELGGVREARRAVRDLPAVEPPDGFLEGLLAPGAEDEGTTVVPLAARRHRRLPLLAAVSVAAAAAVAVVVVGPWQDDRDDASEVEVAIEQHDATVEALEDKGVLGEAPDRLHAREPSTPTTAQRQSLSEMDDAFDAPPELAGYELVEAYDVGDGVHLLYRRGAFAVSVFERKGEVDLDALPDGPTSIRVGDHRAWRWDDLADGRLVVIDSDGVVLTIASDEPGDVVLDVARALVAD